VGALAECLFMLHLPEPLQAVRPKHRTDKSLALGRATAGRHMNRLEPTAKSRWTLVPQEEEDHAGVELYWTEDDTICA
jgi:hypothetical protein